MASLILDTDFSFSCFFNHVQKEFYMYFKESLRNDSWIDPNKNTYDQVYEI